jgi:hypothetical protein
MRGRRREEGGKMRGRMRRGMRARIEELLS